MKTRKIIVVIVFIFIIFSLAIKYIQKIREERAFSHTITYKTIEQIRNNEINAQTLDGLAPYSQIAILLNDNTIWDKLALSNNFKNKYKKSKDIIPDIEKCEDIDVGFSRMDNSKNTILVFGQKRASFDTLFTGKNITTEYTFEYIIDKDNKIDDLILLKEVDVDSMTGETYREKVYDNDNTIFVQ